MANKTFVSNSTLTISDNLTEAVGSSVTGQDNVKIRAGVTGVKLDANFERIDLSGTLASYKFVVVSGTGLQIQNADSSVVATIPNINQSVKIAFTDGSATLAQTGATVFTLNSAALVVGATGAAATVSLAGGNGLNQNDLSTAVEAPSVFVLTSDVAWEGTAAADTLDLRTTTSPTRTLNGGAAGAGAPNTILVKDGVNISGANTLYFTNLSFDATSLSGTNDLTMNATQHAAFTGTILASGTGTSGEKITITDAFTGTGLVNVENYVLSVASTFTLGAAGQNVTFANSAADTVSVESFSVTGVIEGGTVTANTLKVKDGANISSATINNFTNLTFDTAGVSGTNDLTLTAAQHLAFSGTITAAGTGTNAEKITFTTAATGPFVLNSTVENYVLADVTNSVTTTATSQVITGGSGADTINFSVGVTATTVNAGAGDDTITLATGGNTLSISDVAAANGVAVTGTGGADVITFTTAIGVSGTGAAINLGSGADVINLASGANFISVTDNAEATGIAINGGAGVDTVTIVGAIGSGTGTSAAALISLGSGQDVLTLASGANFVYITDTDGLITGSGAAGVDNLEFASVLNSGTTLTFGSGADVLKLASGANVLSIADEAQATGLSITGSAGADTITFTTAVGTGTGASSGELLNMGSGADVINLASGANFIHITDTDGITVNGGSGADNLTFTSGLASGTVLNLSAGADVVTLSSGGNTLSISDVASGNGVAVTGIAGVDTITFTSAIGVASTGAAIDLGSGADIINLASGANYVDVSDADGVKVIGGAGVDTLTLASAGIATFRGGAGVDVISLASGTGTVIVEDSASANWDTITGFTTGTDKLNIDLLTTATAVTSMATGNSGSGYTTTADAVYYLTNSGASGSGADKATVAALINADGIFTNPTADTTAYIINNDGTSTTLWKWVDASGSAGECTTGELTLIGSLTGVLATGDFTFTGA